ncbi:hypothetical protein PoB_001109200 [Plakobranchus ocellatus]|uniref:Uncharacterized protein n=1 Tax=Plakobranchus ocellatus TaxID=259542 RepID=A0AAV3YNQ7_9GAST|nr:hypothetical protein PoB_001109200 [Plakobranchus ocellatus]
MLPSLLSEPLPAMWDFVLSLLQEHDGILHPVIFVLRKPLSREGNYVKENVRLKFGRVRKLVHYRLVILFHSSVAKSLTLLANLPAIR